MNGAIVAARDDRQIAGVGSIPPRDMQGTLKRSFQDVLPLPGEGNLSQLSEFYERGATSGCL